MLTLAVLAAAALGIAAGSYAVSLRLHPRRPCRACGGSGKTRDRIWRAARGTCPKCLGGMRPRFGVRVLQRSRARAMLPRKGAHKKTDGRSR